MAVTVLQAKDSSGRQIARLVATVSPRGIVYVTCLDPGQIRIASEPVQLQVQIGQYNQGIVQSQADGVKQYIWSGPMYMTTDAINQMGVDVQLV